MFSFSAKVLLVFGGLVDVIFFIFGEAVYLTLALFGGGYLGMPYLAFGIVFYNCFCYLQ